MKPIIDVCCGSKMFWFDKENPNVEFCDNRVVPRHEYYKSMYIEIKPDTVCDFTSLPFKDKQFKLVVFDPPHLTRAGDSSWMALKYGCLKGDWKTMLSKGFDECMRVLDDFGVLIFKWSEVQNKSNTFNNRNGSSFNGCNHVDSEGGGVKIWR